MTAFPGVYVYYIVATLVGALLALVVVSVLYIRRMHRRMNLGFTRSQDRYREVEKIGLSKKAEDMLKEVLEEPQFQNELPDKLELSKASVSKASSELQERELIKRKKKSQTYLIEPDIERLEKATGSRFPGWGQGSAGFLDVSMAARR
ncbi:MAG: hypothetical protein ABEJ07_01715 [Candidatus Nanohaloarchaea archaeon]